MQNYFQVGIITGTHGMNGEIKVSPTTNDPGRFGLLKSIYVSDHKISSADFDEQCLVRKKILGTRLYRKSVFIMLENIDNIEDALKIKGKFLLIERKDAVKLEKDEYFIADIIGCLVYDSKRGLLGEIIDVISTGSNDVYMVKGEKYGVVLVPALKSVIKKTDIYTCRIDVELPEGLIND
jgi:16S rRNA processing protein RimM